ncbi:MAG: hypothetical protein Q7S00_00915, partial [bacterium]|nr:hypothetical protein [bacterium]
DGSVIPLDGFMQSGMKDGILLAVYSDKLPEENSKIFELLVSIGIPRDHIHDLPYNSFGGGSIHCISNQEP